MKRLGIISFFCVLFFVTPKVVLGCNGCGCAPTQNLVGWFGWEKTNVSLSGGYQSWVIKSPSYLNPGFFHYSDFEMYYQKLDVFLPLHRRFAVQFSQPFGTVSERARDGYSSTQSNQLANPELGLKVLLVGPPDSLCKKWNHYVMVYGGWVPNAISEIRTIGGESVPNLGIFLSGFKEQLEYRLISEEWSFIATASAMQAQSEKSDLSIYSLNGTVAKPFEIGEMVLSPFVGGLYAEANSKQKKMMGYFNFLTGLSVKFDKWSVSTQCSLPVWQDKSGMERPFGLELSFMYAFPSLVRKK